MSHYKIKMAGYDIGLWADNLLEVATEIMRLKADGAGEVRVYEDDKFLGSY